MTDSQHPVASAAAIEKGERVFLRRPALADEDEYNRLRRESAEFLKPWDPAPPEGIDPYGHVAFEAFLRHSDDKRRQRFLVCRNEDGAIAGGVNLNEIVLGVFLSAYLGYWVGAPHAQKGYMTEALRLVVDHAFGPLGLHRVEANIQPHNVPSLALVKRVGFRREGYSPRYLMIGGRWCDHERWALTAEDWPVT